MRENLLAALYYLGFFGTLAHQLINEYGNVNGLSWVVVIPLDVFLSVIWPIYWVLYLIRQM